QLFAEAAHAPFQGERDRVLPVLEAGERERVDEVVAHQLTLAPAGQLEHATSGGEDAASLVADDEPRVRARVVVVHQLEQEAEAAPSASHRLRRHPLEAVDVDRAVLAVRADVERHASSVAGSPRATVAT